jgi:hypothetical protein
MSTSAAVYQARTSAAVFVAGGKHLRRCCNQTPYAIVAAFTPHLTPIFCYMPGLGLQVGKDERSLRSLVGVPWIDCCAA